ncbi:class I SAM-dependent methyltransferase [Devosia sp. SL43]|uniref:class I SAM-dependent methyltransferase n=1 Tax=Devosia sp. SL43 TaxID=2806348 RepID=UPI001F263D8B|nr:class I SAM-dependent methyltransferase [Devosia sp. SL43]UJW87559.1 class I SAM-dependent methyltransferase [Devosia sp. SL43]
MAKFADNFEGWYKYAERAAGKPPRPLLLEALALTPGRDSALDIGAGALNDAIHLLDIGFRHVTALDGEPIAQEIADTLPADRFDYLIASFEEFAFPRGAYDLLNAQYALPFIRPDVFDRVFAAILASLKPGGVLTGQFFGDRDDWVGTPNMTFQRLDEAKALLSPLTVLSFREEEDPNSQTLNGTAKHWHLYHFIARKD